jgi:hypothetical protein
MFLLIVVHVDMEHNEVYFWAFLLISTVYPFAISYIKLKSSLFFVLFILILYIGVFSAFAMEIEYDSLVGNCEIENEVANLILRGSYLILLLAQVIYFLSNHCFCFFLFIIFIIFFIIFIFIFIVIY